MAKITSRKSRALVVGHLTTIGDLEVLENLTSMLSAVGLPFDVASFYRHVGAAIPGAMELQRVDPAHYSHLIVCCGPVSSYVLAAAAFDINRFRHCTRIGYNLTMVDPLDAFNPFDVLIGRDCENWAFPDLSFLVEAPRLPVVGLCLVKGQAEYTAERRLHERAVDLFERLVLRSGVACVRLDTEFPRNLNHASIGSAAEFESICGRLDVMLTNRLHGTVLALKNGVPSVTLDTIAGGNKVIRQCRAIGWPEVFLAEQVTDDELDAALARCLTPEAKSLAVSVSREAATTWSNLGETFARALETTPGGVTVKSATHQSTSRLSILRRTVKSWRSN